MALEHPWSEPPAPAQTIEVAPGVRWLRMPLPFQLDHINLWLLADGDAEILLEAWTLAMRVRNAVMLVRGKPGDQLPTHPRELGALAAALGYPAGVDTGEVLDDYLRSTRRARTVVERYFSGSAEHQVHG